MKSFVTLTFIAAAVVLMIGCVTTQEKARPLTAEESEIHQTFREMETAWENLDKETFMTYIREDASMMTGRDRYIISKSDLAATYPDKMRQYGPIKYNVRSIKIKDNTAAVKLRVVINNDAYPQTWTVIKETGEWKVKKNRY